MNEIFIVIILFVVVIIAGTVGIFSGLSIKNRLIESVSWPQTEATIIKSQIQSSNNSESGSSSQTTNYTSDIQFSYEVDRTIYKSTAVTSGARIQTNNKEIAQREIDEYPLGKKITVRYNPKKPEECVASIVYGFSEKIPIYGSILFMIPAMIFILSFVFPRGSQYVPTLAGVTFLLGLISWQLLKSNFSCVNAVTIPASISNSEIAEGSDVDNGSSERVYKLSSVFNYQYSNNSYSTMVTINTFKNYNAALRSSKKLKKGQLIQINPEKPGIVYKPGKTHYYKFNQVKSKFFLLLSCLTIFLTIQGVRFIFKPFEVAHQLREEEHFNGTFKKKMLSLYLEHIGNVEPLTPQIQNDMEIDWIFVRKYLKKNSTDKIATDISSTVDRNIGEYMEKLNKNSEDGVSFKSSRDIIIHDLNTIKNTPVSNSKK